MAIDTKRVFCSVFNAIGPLNIQSFTEVLAAAKVEAKRLEPSVTEAALANANGAWYAWLLAIFGEKILAEAHRRVTFLKLPNVLSMNCSLLYTSQLQNLLEDFQAKLNLVAGVNLVTSNPDFAVIRFLANQRSYDFANPINSDHLEKFDSMYREFEGSCNLADLLAYVGVKTSLRPDRRIQLLHEGSLMKAIYTHLKTRNWEITAEGICYYALTLERKEADVDGLRSVATHSIVSASLRPERAVDGLFGAASVAELRDFLLNNFS